MFLPLGGSGPLAAPTHLGWAVVIHWVFTKCPPLPTKCPYMFNAPGSILPDTHTHTEENNELHRSALLGGVILGEIRQFKQKENGTLTPEY